MELFRLFGTIAVNNDEANDAIDSTTNKAEEASGKIGKAFGTIAKGVGVAVTAGATAVSFLTKGAIEACADYEQLVGGVETLFGVGGQSLKEYAEAQGKAVSEVQDEWMKLTKGQRVVLNNAEEAYKTAGLSANEYMETVTSFSASLIQSLSGDTAKASEVAHVAIVDMADNANKMGSSMESIQNAYSGFAKQNYTMLDNLKLGYGGTKEEMERLLADAEKLSGQRFDLSSYADVVEAIHVVQTEMGITGTTAKEASTTISGSISSLKASWENVLTSMADDSADFEGMIEKLVESATTVFSNILPRIQIVFKAIPTLVNNLSVQIPTIVQSILPSLLKGSIALLNGLVSALPSLMKTLVDMIPTLIDNLKPMVKVGEEMLGQILNGFVDSVPNLIEQGLPMLMEFTSNLKEHAGHLVESGIDLILKFGQGLIDGIPTMIQTIPTIVSNIANIINENAPKLIICAGTLIWNLAKGLIEAIPTLIQEIPKIVKAIFDVWSAVNWVNLGKNVVTAIKDGIKKLPEMLTGIWANIKDGAVKMWNGIKTGITTPVTSAKALIQTLVTGIKSNLSGAWNSIKSITVSVWNGIKSAITSPIQTAKNVIKSIIDNIKKMFNFTVTLPHIKLPHFAINPSGWKLGDLLKGSIPSLGISWYAKAMDEPYMFTKPTIVGAKGFGEAGDEIVYGRRNLMSDIREASQGSSELLQEKLNRIIELLEQIFGIDIVLDSGVLVGQLAPAMDGQLGNINRLRDRGQ